MIGQTISHYRIVETLGSGGMGVVYKAEDVKLNRFVALKFLPDEFAADPRALNRFQREARAASSLNHPNICTIHEVDEVNGRAFIVMELIEGQTLRQEISGKPQKVDTVLDFGIQIADALGAAHSKGIVHRDIKPENIMLVAGDHSPGQVKILDFGLAKLDCALSIPEQEETVTDTIPLVTSPGILVGTVTYMTPEQLKSQPLDARTDIYTLGLVLYEMATGVNPFVGKTVSLTIANILEEEAPPIRQKDSAVSIELDRILLKCLRKHREERYQSARELLIDLRDLRRNILGSLPTQTRDIEASLLHRFFSLFGATPYRRWEIMHLRMIVWCLLLAYLGWRFTASTPDKWEFVLFILQLAGIALLLTLLGFLLYTGASDPGDLSREVQRIAPWVRWSTVAVVLMTWVMAGMVIVSHRLLAAFLIVCSTAGGFKYLLFKAAFDRAAFPAQPPR